MIKYHVLSPDGLPITLKPFDSEADARAYIPRWCYRFKSQGYYSAVGGRIPLSALPHRLIVVSFKA